MMGFALMCLSSLAVGGDQTSSFGMLDQTESQAGVVGKSSWSEAYRQAEPELWPVLSLLLKCTWAASLEGYWGLGLQ